MVPKTRRNRDPFQSDDGQETRTTSKEKMLQPATTKRRDWIRYAFLLVVLFLLGGIGWNRKFHSLSKKDGISDPAIYIVVLLWDTVETVARMGTDGYIHYSVDGSDRTLKIGPAEPQEENIVVYYSRVRNNHAWLVPNPPVLIAAVVVLATCVLLLPTVVAVYVWYRQRST